MKIFFKSDDGYTSKEFTFNEFGNQKFQVVGDIEPSGTNRYSYNNLKTIAEDLEKDILIVNSNPSENLEIVKIIDMQKFLYEQKKAKKDSEKKQKAMVQKVKEIKFHINIAENDLNTKVEHIKKFLEDKCKVKLVLELRGREVGMKDYASEIWTNIISNFNGYNIDETKFINNSFFTFITK